LENSKNFLKSKVENFSKTKKKKITHLNEGTLVVIPMIAGDFTIPQIHSLKFFSKLLQRQCFFLSLFILTRSPMIMYLGIFAYFAVVVVYYGTFEAAKAIHNELLRIIIRAPVNKFFDITPIGRILNHFSGDMEVIDEELPGTADNVLSFIFMVFVF